MIYICYKSWSDAVSHILQPQQCICHRMRSNSHTLSLCLPPFLCCAVYVNNSVRRSSYAIAFIRGNQFILMQQAMTQTRTLYNKSTHKHSSNVDNPQHMKCLHSSLCLTLMSQLKSKPFVRCASSCCAFLVYCESHCLVLVHVIGGGWIVFESHVAKTCDEICIIHKWWHVMQNPRFFIRIDPFLSTSFFILPFIQNETKAYDFFLFVCFVYY